MFVCLFVCRFDAIFVLKVFLTCIVFLPQLCNTVRSSVCVCNSWAAQRIITVNTFYLVDTFFLSLSFHHLFIIILNNNTVVTLVNRFKLPLLYHYSFVLFCFAEIFVDAEMIIKKVCFKRIRKVSLFFLYYRCYHYHQLTNAFQRRLCCSSELSNILIDRDFSSIFQAKLYILDAHKHTHSTPRGHF